MSDAFQIIKVSIEIVAKYFGIALRYCAGWAVLITALYYLMYFVVPQGTNLYKGIYSLKGLLFNAAILFIFIVALVSCSINWHRFVLLDEKPKGIFSIPPMDIVLSYFFKSALLASLIVIIVAIFLLVLFYINPIIYDLTGVKFLPVTYYPIVYFLVLYFVLRLSILLPVVAIGGAKFTIAKSWALSKNVKATIFFITSIFIMLWFVFSRLTDVLTEVVNSNWQRPVVIEIIYFTANMILNWFLFIAFIGLITFLYARATEAQSS